MANIPFKSITFPELPNKYTVPEISSDLMTAGKAADAKATGDALSALEDSMNDEVSAINESLGDVRADLGAEQISGGTDIAGVILADTSVMRFNSSTSVEYAVNGGESLFIKANSSRSAYFSFLQTSVTLLSDGDTADWCDGETKPRAVSTGTEASFIVPSDCRYILMTSRSSGKTYYPESALFVANDGAIGRVKAQTNERIDTIAEKTDSVAEQLGAELDLTESTSFIDGYGVYYKYNGQATTSTICARSDWVNVSEFDRLRFTRRLTTLAGSYGYAFYYENVDNQSGNLVAGARDPSGYDEFGAETITIDVPEGANWFRCTWFKSDQEGYEQYPFSLVGIVRGAIKDDIEHCEESIVALNDKVNPQVSDVYADELEDTIAKARDSITEPSLVMLWATDIHRWSANAGVQTFEDMIRNMGAFAQRVTCDFVLDTGDLTDGNGTQAVTIERAYDCAEKFKNIGIPRIWAQGNHDTNYVNRYTFTTDECYKAYFTAIGKCSAYNANEGGTDYYIDYDGLNLRLIVLNANNVTDNLEYAYGSTTAAWLTSALDTTKDVIVFVHQSPYTAQVYNNQGTTLASGIRTALEGYVSRGTGVLTMLSGHSHLDVAFINPFVSIMQDCQRFSSVSEDDTSDAHGMTGYIDVVRNNARNAGDYTADLWSVVVYKALSKELDLIRFGAGKDRYFHLEPIEPTTVDSKLTGVTWSTSDATVATVSEGVITGVASGRCAILAKDADGNYECWIVVVN